MSRILEIAAEGEYKYNGCWEQRENRVICRWIIVWKTLGKKHYAGCIGGYSGGGSFQLEKFYINKQKIVFGFDDTFSTLSSKILEHTENCQDYALSPHDSKSWLESDNLVLSLNNAVGEDDTIITEGDPIDEDLIVVFEKVGLTARPI
jgi:hypothetical protein